MDRAFSIDDLAALARRRLPRAVYDFYEGGAEDETSLRANREAFGGVRLLPRALVDVGTVDTAASLLGATVALPLGIAPMGAVGFGRRGGDVDLARAAAKAGIPYVLSTTGTASIERIGDVGGRLWFQLYPLKRRDAAVRLVERARAAGFEALVLTVDVPVGGKRERDLRNDFAMPFRYTPRNVLDFASRPAWALDMLWHGVPVLENMAGLADTAADASQMASSVGREFDPAFGWHDLDALRDAWRGKLIVKGILRAADARRAVDIGCDGVIVSNHGGRQLDAAVDSLTALPAIVAEVGHRADVMVDGGIRRGSDIVKALALGAKAVLIGRPALYGVCAQGEAGATRSIDILRDELVRTLRLCGLPAVARVTADALYEPEAIFGARHTGEAAHGTASAGAVHRE
ncbi:alpha-hydroxy-acid oxidizing enzyme [Rhodoferax koreense]|uniref:Alpha-hydroxy-acid oxidizing enzyme n=1 Tax=Rhodoferax koreensis TaxID=1842727 RepID=A0A1P8K4F2_9BURK|nr:alpha-hydroxy-acid oxidizing enzyme [Rhodoferax koreense]